MVDGYFSQFKSVVSDVSQGGVLLYTTDKWSDLENKVISYADDTTLYAEIVPPFDFINVADFLN